MSDPSFPFREVFERDLAAFADGWPAHLHASMRGGSPEDDFAGVSVLAFHCDARTKPAWVAVLPRLTTVTCLWAKTVVDNALFAAISKMSALTHLDIEQSRLESCDLLSVLGNLTHLAVGSSSRLKSLAPIATLPCLSALSLKGTFPHIGHLHDALGAQQLLGLTLSGSFGGRTQTYDSLEPVSRLKTLRYFGIAGIRIRAGGVRPLAALEQLEYLFIDQKELKRWPASDYAELHDKLPNLKHDLIRLAATDRDFQRKHGIR